MLNVQVAVRAKSCRSYPGGSLFIENDWTGAKGLQPFEAMYHGTPSLREREIRIKRTRSPEDPRKKVLSTIEAKTIAPT
jgi:hypothetical protein